MKQETAYQTALHWYGSGVNDATGDSLDMTDYFKQEYGSLFDEKGDYATSPCEGDNREQKNEWGVVCEKCGWEGLAHQLLSNHLEDNCPLCHSNKIEWKGEDEEKGFEALYKELAYMEKQRNEQHQKEITALKNELKDYKEECDRLAGIADFWQKKYYDELGAGYSPVKIDNL